MLHIIRADDLKTLVLRDINRHITLSNRDVEQYISYLIKQSDSELNGEKSTHQKELQNIKQRLGEIGTILQSMYEDKKKEAELKEWHTEIQTNLSSFI